MRLSDGELRNGAVSSVQRHFCRPAATSVSALVVPAGWRGGPNTERLKYTAAVAAASAVGLTRAAAGDLNVTVR